MSTLVFSLAVLVFGVVALLAVQACGWGLFFLTARFWRNKVAPTVKKMVERMVRRSPGK